MAIPTKLQAVISGDGGGAGGGGGHRDWSFAQFTDSRIRRPTQWQRINA